MVEADKKETTKKKKVRAVLVGEKKMKGGRKAPVYRKIFKSNNKYCFVKGVCVRVKDLMGKLLEKKNEVHE